MTIKWMQVQLRYSQVVDATSTPMMRQDASATNVSASLRQLERRQKKEGNAPSSAQCCGPRQQINNVQSAHAHDDGDLALADINNALP
jgi:hypothetical protein